MGQNSRTLGWLLAIPAAVLAIGCDQKAAPPPPPTPVVTVSHPIEHEVIEWDEFTGRLDASEKVNLIARVSGFVLKADFKEGNLVEKDQVLVELDPTIYDAELARATGQVQQAEAQSRSAAAEFDRIERLRKGGGGSEKEYSDSRYAMQQAAAAVLTAKAAQKLATDNLNWTKVRTEIAGRVSDKKVTAGNIVNGGAANGTQLTTILREDPIYCYIDADEQSVLKYQRLSHENKRISARSEPIPCFLQLGNEQGFPHQGVIDFVDNRIDPGTGTLRARGVFKNPTGSMLPGFFARVRIPGSGRYRAILVPDSAIDTNQNIKFLRVVGKDNLIEARTVTIGSLFGSLRVIEKGVEATELIVTNGIQRAMPGSKVEPKEAPIDLSGFQMTAPGSPATQALPATRYGSTQPATLPSTQPAGGLAQ